MERRHLERWRRGRRMIATDIEENTVSLPEFRHRPGDVFLLGNEYGGLPSDVREAADEVLSIPMPQVWTPRLEAIRPIDPDRGATVARDGQPSLNVAMTAGILCYAIYLNTLEAQGRLEVVAAPAFSRR